MVEACGGFDADLASAYLENALGVSIRSRYDAHLAGCPSCRRQVIELSRLINQIQETPQFQPQIYPISEQSGIWERIRALAAGWFEGLDFSASKWGWATAGATAAVLIGVFSVQLWRQNQPATRPTNESAMAVNSVGEAPQPTPFSDNSVADLNGTVPISAGTTSPQAPFIQNTQIPRPPVGPISSGTNAITTLPPGMFEIRNRQIPLNTAFSISEATGPNSLVVQLPAPPPPQMIASNAAPAAMDGVSSAGFSNRAGVVAPLESTEASAEKARDNAVAAKINPSPSDNPMVRSKKKNDSQPTRGVLDKALSFLPTRDSNGGTKLEEKEIEPDAPKLLTIRVRDKILSYQSGMWIDSAYKPEMAWRVTKLVRDSEDFKQVLASEPQLKEYFDRGAIIIVWKDKIYKVVNK